MAKVYTMYQHCREGISREIFTTAKSAYEYAFEYVKRECEEFSSYDEEDALEDDMPPSLALRIMSMEPMDAVLAWNAFFEKNTYSDDYYLEVEEVTVKD